MILEIFKVRNFKNNCWLCDNYWCCTAGTDAKRCTKIFVVLVLSYLRKVCF